MKIELLVLIIIFSVSNGLNVKGICGCAITNNNNNINNYFTSSFSVDLSQNVMVCQYNNNAIFFREIGGVAYYYDAHTSGFLSELVIIGGSVTLDLDSVYDVLFSCDEVSNLCGYTYIDFSSNKVTSHFGKVKFTFSLSGEEYLFIFNTNMNADNNYDLITIMPQTVNTFNINYFGEYDGTPNQSLKSTLGNAFNIQNGVFTSSIC